MNPPAFPEDFVFGLATSAYQSEGHLENDWTDWERQGRLKDPAVRSGRGVEHWARFVEDLSLVTGAGATAYRMSIEWARVEPRPGEFDPAALEGYRTRLEAMRARGIRPIVTLHHFTNPPWLHAQAPWHSPAVLTAWRRFVKAVAPLLDGLGAAVITFNEPFVFLLGGFLQGVMPPGQTDGPKAMAALENMVRAHVIAREELLLRHGAVTVGISQHLMAFAPERWWNPLDQALARLAHANVNQAWLEALHTGQLKVTLPGLASLNVKVDGAARSTEFVGVNYYTRSHLKFIARKPFVEMKFNDVGNRGLTDIGWEQYPEGFFQLLLELKKYGQPVWVTENGIDDRTGARRSEFLYRHWEQLLKARAAGVDIRTYLHWSLFDNFEWLEGWGPRFGLYRVDFETLERTPTPSVEYFRRVATSRRLTPP